MNIKVIRYKQVKERVGYSRQHLSRLEHAGQFPKRIELGPKSVGWIESEVDAWIAGKADARKAGNTSHGGANAAPSA